MSEYILIDNELYHADELMHYGVLGMKWGKRKNPSRAFAKSAKKADKLQKRINKTAKKINKTSVKINRYNQYNQYGDKEKANALTDKKYRLEQTLEKRRNKSQKWEDTMSKTFRKTKMSSITQKDLITGRDYVYMLSKG